MFLLFYERPERRFTEILLSIFVISGGFTRVSSEFKFSVVPSLVSSLKYCSVDISPLLQVVSKNKSLGVFSTLKKLEKSFEGQSEISYWAFEF